MTESGGGQPRGACPGCGARLTEGGVYRAPGDRSACLGCGLRTIELLDSAGFVARVRSKKHSPIRCSGCGRTVHTVLLASSERMVEVEYCRPCQLVFVEADEVDAAAALFR